MLLTKFRLTRLAGAVIFAALVRANGPLFQQAIKTESRQAIDSVVIKADMMEALPQGWSGVMSTNVETVNDVSPSFARIIGEYKDRKPIMLRLAVNNQGCEGEEAVCEAMMLGTGFKVECREEEFGYDLRVDPEVMGQAAQEVVVFETNVTELAGRSGSSGFAVRAGWKERGDCAGTGRRRVCEFVPWRVRYKVEIRKGREVRLMGNYGDDELVGAYYEGDVPWDSKTSTFGGFTFAFREFYESRSVRKFLQQRALGWVTESTGLFPGQHLRPEAGEFVNGVGTECTQTQYNDPMQGIIAGIREVMLRSSIEARKVARQFDGQKTITTIAQGTNIFSARRSRPVQVYVSNYPFLGIALAVVLVAALVVLLTFIGYNKLGRSVSMSPIEVAKAFGAPLLESGGSNESIEGLLKLMERRGMGEVQYGEVLVGEERRLGFEGVGNVQRPRRGARYL
ncbi:hypothetical protein BJ508DRAFT_171406 [Ascobolus immersus RN42]|uniref:Uncharacterized protein n=1 Tax=Ascobolus immersus RN42 TaxID=1160509 RepID=A0A3N4HUR5_ASCIM|nr:hypothetical protein BJ508DRAFT_171406 [Ascobolus immersus RN42]